MTTQEFITQNLDADIRDLALRHAGRTDIDLHYALDQIAGRRTAQTKLPMWVATDGIIYPPHISMEQCSSEQTAMYKAKVAQRLIAELPVRPVLPPTPTTLIDLTGGFGVDFSYMARAFGRAVYIERQSHLCAVSRHNMTLLGLTQAEVVCGDCTQIIEEMDDVTMFYADPARRDARGGRTFAISDCTPDITAMRDTLLGKAHFTMVKLSPMLDWRKAVADMGGCVGEVHIVSVANECKELLLVMSRKYASLERICCVNDGQTFSFTPEEAANATLSHNPQTPQPHNPTTVKPHNPITEKYLYEPNASLMKAGCFALIAQRYGCRQVGADSHLFVSRQEIPHFPGRGFAIRAVATMNKRELRAALGGTGQANVSVRNFPMTADALRKKLKLKDGGDTYIFGTTTADSRHVLIICEKHHQNQTIQS